MKEATKVKKFGSKKAFAGTYVSSIYFNFCGTVTILKTENEMENGNFQFLEEVKYFIKFLS